MQHFSLHVYDENVFSVPALCVNPTQIMDTRLKKKTDRDLYVLLTNKDCTATSAKVHNDIDRNSQLVGSRSLCVFMFTEVYTYTSNTLTKTRPIFYN